MKPKIRLTLAMIALPLMNSAVTAQQSGPTVGIPDAKYHMAFVRALPKDEIRFSIAPLGSRGDLTIQRLAKGAWAAKCPSGAIAAYLDAPTKQTEGLWTAEARGKAAKVVLTEFNSLVDKVWRYCSAK